jgi:hypothetical protein
LASVVRIERRKIRSETDRSIVPAFVLGNVQTVGHCQMAVACCETRCETAE